MTHPRIDIPEGFRAFPTAVSRASTTLFPNVAALREAETQSDPLWSYGLNSTPTQMELAQRLAQMEGGAHCLLLPSGLSAISLTLFACLKAGDEILAPDNAYGPLRTHANWLARDYGLQVRYYDPMLGAGVGALISPQTKLIWIETPGSVTMELPDVPAIAAAARGILTAMDHTWTGGLLIRPFELGVDISIQALTKYQSGASDVLMGSVVTRDAALHTRLLKIRKLLGLGVSSDDCYFILRSLPTLAARLRAHEERALALAQWLRERPEVYRVLHPAFPECPGHVNWLRDYSGASSLFSAVFHQRFGQSRIDAFIDDLRLFGIGYSWGGAHSLALPYDIPAMRSAASWPPADWPAREDAGILVRFYCGLEDAPDLIEDVRQSMARHLV
ncbi:MAG: cystathionine beta-lyase [Candidatus Protistobacter heckmanni]|nr:cystathionine beta-lyase [Candidatus Protistobacter heckmanni]